MFYTSKNVSLTVNDSGIFASSVSLGIQTEVGPNYRVGKRIVTQYENNGPPRGSLSLTYYLTGVDPLRVCMEEENTNLSGNFAGMYFNSGRLLSYGLDMSPYGALEASVDIEFYEEIKGSYTPTQSNIPKERVLTVGDVNFTSTTSIGSEKILNLSYNYDIEMTPRIVVGSTEPVDYVMGEKSVSFSCDVNDLTIDVPTTGRLEAASIELRDENENVKETFYINGVMFAQKVSAAHGLMSKEITISQSNLGLSPTISSFSPNGGPVGTTVTVAGSNFNNVRKVFLSDTPATFAVSSSSSMTFDIPADPSGMSGPISVITEGGEVMSTTSFSVS